MPNKNKHSPGVYTVESSAFTYSAELVPTAVPAFIGYTPKAEFQGTSYLNTAHKITSFAEFQAIYLLPDPPPPAAPARQYQPHYHLVLQPAKPTGGAYLKIAGEYYSILPDVDSIYYMVNSIRLFYMNGGADAYIVSVGTYGPAGGQSLAAWDQQIVNRNVRLSDLQRGLALLKQELEPTLYICPEATLLDVANNGTLMQAMLLQANEMQTAVCIFDLVGARNPEPLQFTQDIEAFRNNTGSNGLRFGASYYPFVVTTVMQAWEIDFTNLFGGDTRKLAALINPPGNQDPKITSLFDGLQAPTPHPYTTQQYSAALAVASATYKEIVELVLREANILPPSGGMAGIYTTTDNDSGVWKAPANVSMLGVYDLTIRLNAAQQENLNVDISGKSVNALRFFSGQGIRVWGARTLDGNSAEWRYIPVRRTVTMLEQTVKLAVKSYVFEPNDANTWSAIKSTIENLLNKVWRAGGLQGNKAADAFFVNVGLGATMTNEDILNGRLIIQLGVAPLRPAEFIIISIEQQMPVQ